MHAHFVTDSYIAAASTAGHPRPDGMPAWPTWSVDEHLALMDSSNITRSILSISSPGVHFGDNGSARALARHVNDFAAELTRAWPDRFGQFAALPLPDIDGAIAEAIYALDHLGADGVNVLSNSAGIYLGNPVLDPLLSELDQRHATVFVHPTSPPNWETVARTPPPADRIPFRHRPHRRRPDSLGPARALPRHPMDFHPRRWRPSTARRPDRPVSHRVRRRGARSRRLDVVAARLRLRRNAIPTPTAHPGADRRHRPDPLRQRLLLHPALRSADADHLHRPRARGPRRRPMAPNPFREHRSTCPSQVGQLDPADARRTMNV